MAAGSDDAELPSQLPICYFSMVLKAKALLGILDTFTARQY